MTEWKAFTVRIAEQVAEVTLTGPGKHNAMGPDFWRDLPLLFGELDADPQVRAIVITGSGRNFSVGLDLRAMRPVFDEVLAAGSPAARRTRFHRTLCRMQQTISAVAEEFGLCDTEAVTLPTACAAGNYAIGYGCDALRSGEVEVALVGGADAICRKTFAGFYRLGTIAPEHCRPFDSARQGILTGEGAAVLVLERRDRALARGARVYAEVLGYGLNCDADHPVAPNRASVARCMALAHRNSGITPGDVDFISAHGTGTKANDVTEAAAIREVFGAHPPPTISTKSMIGHTMGAASALAAVACCLALTHQFIPPTINHEHTDPECGGLDCVPNHARPAALRVVQNNALAFGGNNAVLVLAAHDTARREAS
jgi:3-oxoacyl-[acyl-carrier-protein] synthase II